MSNMVPAKEEKEKVRTLLQQPKSAAGMRSVSVRKKKEEPAKPKFVVPDTLVPLPEEMLVKLTVALRGARNAGEKLKSGYGVITKEITGLWDACLHRVGGDKTALQHASLSDAMLIVFRSPEAVDLEFGEGTFKETRTATNGGASTWRKPWSRIKKTQFGSEKVIKTPLEKFSEECMKAAATGEVPYHKAYAALNRAFGKG